MRFSKKYLDFQLLKIEGFFHYENYLRTKIKKHTHTHTHRFQVNKLIALLRIYYEKSS